MCSTSNVILSSGFQSGDFSQAAGGRFDAFGPGDQEAGHLGSRCSQVPGHEGPEALPNAPRPDQRHPRSAHPAFAPMVVG